MSTPLLIVLQEKGDSSTWQASSSLEARRAANMAQNELFKKMLGLVRTQLM